MYRLRVLGGFALEGSPGGSAPDMPQRRTRAVLAVLAVCGDLGCTRERLLALLWPESDEARSRHGLSDALHALRAALGQDVVLSAGDLLHLNPTVVVSDVLSFAQALAFGRDADAVQAYRGPLLDGIHVDGAPEFERWLDGERTRLARQCAEALEHLAAAAERTGAWGEAAGWWARAEEHDPLNSHFALRHAQALAAIGDRANAIKVVDAHARRLREDLELEPDAEVLAAIERFRTGHARAPDSHPPRPGAGTDRPTAGAERQLAPERPVPPDGAAAAGHVPRWIPWAAVISLVVFAAIVALRRWPSPPTVQPQHPRTAIAVLPFQNLGVDTSHAYLAGALHEELLTQLAKVGALTVIGRTSVLSYAGTTKRLSQIGSELAVGSIVEGSVQVAGGRLRVNVQLVDPATEAHLWAEHYDRTLDDAFAVQSDIAQRIVAAVGATLSSAEAGAITAPPTQNAEAYQLYLQGREYQRRAGWFRPNLESAQQLYERALALDSTFALAHAALASIHRGMLMMRYDPSPARTALQRREVQAALRYGPDLPQVRLAVGMAYSSRGPDDRGALRELDAALRAAPNDADLWEWKAYIHRWFGDWDSVDVAFEHARRLDPRNADLFMEIGNTGQCLRRFSDAIAAFRRALLLAPDVVQPHLSLAWSYVLWKGEMDTLRAVLRGLPEVQPSGGAPPVSANRAIVFLLDRQPDSVLRLVRTMQDQAWASQDLFLPRALIAAYAHLLRGDSVAARFAFDSAAALLDSAERSHPGDSRVHVSRGIALAGLGRRTEALNEARWLEQSEGYRENRYCPLEQEGRALILVRAGAVDAALVEAERMLFGRSGTTAHMLRLDPRWDPIRGDPRFQALLVKYNDLIRY